MLREFDFESMPVADLVNEIIIDAVNRGASDIHFDPKPESLLARIRIDGELVDYTSLPIGIKNHIVTKIKILSGMNITESRLPQDGAIKTTIQEKNLDLRVSTLPTVYGEKVVIRILDYTRSMEGLDTLGFNDNSLDKLNRIIKNPNGIILVTGATGTGKSTTVYAILDRLNTRERNIITVEDPVEMKIDGINQVQAMSEIGLTFATVLRSILRQDPDTIMIGEIRDDETARIAVRAAITGHLVLSTIHTNNSLNTIERLLDMDVERYLLGSALVGIVSQRLTKKLCPKCRATRATTDYEKVIFKKALKMDVDEIYEPVGCDECYKGYKGRIAIQEVLSVNQEVRDAILNNIRKDELRRIIYENGKTQTLLQDGLEKVLNGLTSFDEVLRVIEVDSDFGDDDKDIKDAIMGKSKNIFAKQETETTEENKEDNKSENENLNNTEQANENNVVKETQISNNNEISEESKIDNSIPNDNPSENNNNDNLESEEKQNNETQNSNSMEIQEEKIETLDF